MVIIFGDVVGLCCFGCGGEVGVFDGVVRCGVVGSEGFG